MPGAVDEVLPVTGAGNVVPHRFIHLPSGNGTTFSHRRLHGLDAGIARPAYHLKNPPDTVAGRFADEPGPSDVVVDGPGRLHLSPNVQQNEISLADRLGGFCRW